MASHLRETRPVTSREYKAMLRADFFGGDEQQIVAAAERFRSAVVRTIIKAFDRSKGKSNVHGRFRPGKSDKQATVQFFDTRDRRLRRSGLIFRVRRPVTGGPLELTLKRRHPDRFFVSGCETGGKSKFEEDIKASSAERFVSLHSLSGTVRGVADETEFQSLRHVRQFYKPLKKLLGKDYQAKEELLRVCDFTAVQTVLEGVTFDVSKRCEAECALILWHQMGRDSEIPAVVEFSFRYRDKDIGANQEPFTSAMAKRCMDILESLYDGQSSVAPWIDLVGPTKTAYAYGLTRL